jgi:hypothetical protein
MFGGIFEITLRLLEFHLQIVSQTVEEFQASVPHTKTREGGGKYISIYTHKH